jgi:crotonobetainyl-CoA:carnitine CoA-transferase CaiB-like acyl-CoA transferase
MRYFVTGRAPEPLGTRHPSATPFQAFPTADGHVVVALGFGEENQWAILCGILGLAELIDDARFDTSPKRTARHGELEPLLAAAFRTRTTAEWIDDMLAAGIPCGPVNTIADAAADPQVHARGMLQQVEHPIAGTVTIANTPVRMSRSESGIKGPPPGVGEHTAAVLAELLGYSPEDVDRLRSQGVIATEGGPDLDAILG